MKAKRMVGRGVRAAVVLVLIASVSALAVAQEQDAEEPTGLLSRGLLQTTGGFSLNDSDNLFLPRVGSSADLRHVFNLGPGLPLFYAGLSLEYSYIPFRVGSGLSLPAVMVHGGVDFPVFPRFLLGLDVRGGYYAAVGGGLFSGGSAILTAGGHAKYQITPRFTLGLGSAFRTLLSIVPNPDFNPDNPGGTPAALPLFQVDAGLETIYHFGVPDLTPFALGEQSVEVIYPHLDGHYRNAPFGVVEIRHTGGYDMRNLSATVTVDGLSEAPRPVAITSDLQPGSSTSVTLLMEPTFAENAARRGGDAEAIVELSYNYRGWDRTQRLAVPVQIYGTGDVAWNDPARLALFAHAEEPLVGEAAGAVRDGTVDIGTKEIDASIRNAAAVYAFMQSRGIEDDGNAAGTWQAAGEEKETAAARPFVRDVLTGGTSTSVLDRAVLYGALLEAQGTAAAFVTVGDRLFVAAAMEAAPEEIEGVFAHPETLLEHDGRLWFPLDPAELEADFLDVHRRAADAVVGAEGAQVAPLQQAWETYRPAHLHAQGNPPLEIDAEALASSFAEGLGSVVAWEIEPRVAELEAQLRRRPDDIDLQNELGVLYGRYHLYQQARRRFSDILLDNEYVPTLINMGNVFFAQDEMRRALPFYQRAFEQEPFNPNVLLALAKVEHALENYGNAELAYQRLQSIAADVAETYSHLALRGEEARRAAEAAGLADIIEWQVAE